MSNWRNSEGYYDPVAGEALDRIEKENAFKKTYRPLVYICSPFAGDVENNVLSARHYCKYAVRNGYIPIAAHLLFPQFLDDENRKERSLGLFFGKVLMDRCDEVWMFGGSYSTGMQTEYDRAVRKKYTIRYFTEDCREVTSREEAIQ